MIDVLEDVKKQAEAELNSVNDEISLQNFKAKFVGRKGVITDILKGMKDIPDSDRPRMGKLINETKTFVEDLIEHHSERGAWRARRDRGRAASQDLL